MRCFLSVAIAATMFFISSHAQALSLSIENQSEWEIHELYFSPVDQTTWGPDQLSDKIIESGSTFTLKKIAADDYDMKIVDEDGDSCVVRGVDFSESEHFVLTDKLLLGCEKNSEQDAEEEEDEE